MFIQEKTMSCFSWGFFINKSHYATTCKKSLCCNAAIILLISGHLNVYPVGLSLRKGHQLVGDLCVLTFHGSNCGKGPTGITGALLLDGGHQAVVPPVDGRWEWCGVVGLEGGFRFRLVDAKVSVAIVDDVHFHVGLFGGGLGFFFENTLEVQRKYPSCIPLM